VIEVEVRAELARRLAPHERAPPRLIRSLADDEIVVAHPVLARSLRLKDSDLIAIARSRGLDHCRAIAERPELSEPVTDTLLTRADRPLLHRLVAHSGARFSIAGTKILVDRAQLDAELQVLLRARPDLAREDLAQAFVLAEATAREHLAATTPPVLAPEMEEAFGLGAKRVRAAAGALDYGAALDTIGAIEIGRPIDEEDVAAFAGHRQLEETICATASCAGLSLKAAERLFTVADSDLLLIVGKAKGWSWSTMQALFGLKDPEALDPVRLRRLASTYEDLAAGTAERVLGFVQRQDRKG